MDPEAQAGSAQGGRPSNKRLQQTQAQVDEVVGIMKVNVEKVLERDQKLSQLDDRADALQVSFLLFLKPGFKSDFVGRCFTIRKICSNIEEKILVEEY